MHRFLAPILMLALAAPPALAQDGPAPPPELDPGQAILPRDPDREPERVELEVGRRTTYFEGPLRDDGTVDYIAALNAKYSEGVTTDNNAFVELMLLMPESARSEEIDALTLEALGLPPRREDEDACFVPWDEYAIELGVADPGVDDFYLRDDNTITPDGQRWLEANQAALDRVVEATRRPRYWAPMVAHGDGVDSVLSVHLPQLGYHRQLARALQARIYDKADRGELESAVDDILAVRRLAALQRQDPTLIGVLVGISIDANAHSTLKHLLVQRTLDTDALDRLAAGWDDRVAVVPMSEHINIGERSMALDMIQQLWSGRVASDEGAFGIPRFAEYASPRFDINRALRTINGHYSRLTLLMRMENYEEYQRFSRRFNEEWERRHATLNQDAAGIASDVAAAALTRNGFTDLLTNMFMNVLLPALGAARNTEIRNATHEYAVYVAIQCERYRLSNGDIPPSIDALVPDYLDQVPRDPIDGEPMRYRATNAGFVVYSIGTDLIDHGGLRHDYREGDIAVGVGIDVEPGWDD
ncbi:hypothetical protein OT109_03425 [Phycisphaeraceae bacterium D3-23]